MLVFVADVKLHAVTSPQERKAHKLLFLVDEL